MPKKRSVKRHLVAQPLDQSYRLIPLTQGQNAIVDAADFEWLSQWNWYALWSPQREDFYALRRDYPAGTFIYMHQFITGAKETDHKNGHGLDNRRENLRSCTHSQNVHNSALKRNNTSGFKGVTWDKSRGMWESRIMNNYKTKYLGRFSTAKDAAHAYDVAAKELHGEFCRKK